MQFITTMENAKADAQAVESIKGLGGMISIRITGHMFDSVVIFVSRECAKQLRDSLDAVLFEEELLDETKEIPAVEGT